MFVIDLKDKKVLQLKYQTDIKMYRITKFAYVNMIRT